MKPMNPTQAKLWGKTSTVTPYRLDATFGQGATYWIEAMEDRPHYYVFEGSTDLDIADRLDDILDAIDDESAEHRTDEQWDEIDETGHCCETRKFPIPPEPHSMGWAWGEFDEKELNQWN